MCTLCYMLGLLASSAPQCHTTQDGGGYFLLALFSSAVIINMASTHL